MWCGSGGSMIGSDTTDQKVTDQRWQYAEGADRFHDHADSDIKDRAPCRIDSRTGCEIPVT
jgi:hypothetical protein